MTPPKSLDDHPKSLDEYENLELDIITKEKIVIGMIKENPYVTFEDVADKLNISITSARRIFRTLRKKGIIESRINQYDKWRLKEYK